MNIHRQAYVISGDYVMNTYWNKDLWFIFQIWTNMSFLRMYNHGRIYSRNKIHMNKSTSYRVDV
jgi:hypothetical protein